MRGAVCTTSRSIDCDSRYYVQREAICNFIFTISVWIWAKKLFAESAFAAVKEVANSVAGKRHHTRGQDRVEKVTRVVQGGCRGDGGGVSGDVYDVYICIRNPLCS